MASATIRRRANAGWGRRDEPPWLRCARHCRGRESDEDDVGDALEGVVRRPGSNRAMFTKCCAWRSPARRSRRGSSRAWRCSAARRRWGASTAPSQAFDRNLGSTVRPLMPIGPYVESPTRMVGDPERVQRRMQATASKSKPKPKPKARKATGRRSGSPGMSHDVASALRARLPSATRTRATAGV